MAKRAAILLILVVIAPLLTVPRAHAESKCRESICRGMYAKITSGEFAGNEGSVVSINRRKTTATIITPIGESLIPLLTDITPQTASSWDGCLANVCIGARVKVLSGLYLGKKARVVGLNPANAMATLLVKRKYYVTISVTELEMSTPEIDDNPPNPGMPRSNGCFGRQYGGPYNGSYAAPCTGPQAGPFRPFGY